MFEGLAQGTDYVVSEDLTMQGENRDQDWSEFYTADIGEMGCDETASCDPSTGDGLMVTCDVTNNDNLVRHRRSIDVTQAPWTYDCDDPGTCNVVTDLHGSFNVLNVSNNQPNDVLIANLNIRLYWREGGTGKFMELEDSADCTFSPASPFVIAAPEVEQDFGFWCDVSTLDLMPGDVVKVWAEVNLFQGHKNNFTSAYTQEIQ